MLPSGRAPRSPPPPLQMKCEHCTRKVGRALPGPRPEGRSAGGRSQRSVRPRSGPAAEGLEVAAARRPAGAALCAERAGVGGGAGGPRSGAAFARASDSASPHRLRDHRGQTRPVSPRWAGCHSRTRPETRSAGGLGSNCAPARGSVPLRVASLGQSPGPSKSLRRGLVFLVLGVLTVLSKWFSKPKTPEEQTCLGLLRAAIATTLFDVNHWKRQRFLYFLKTYSACSNRTIRVGRTRAGPAPRVTVRTVPWPR